VEASRVISEGETGLSGSRCAVRFNEDSRFIMYIGDKTIGGITWRFTDGERQILFSDGLSATTAEIRELSERRLVLQEDEHTRNNLCGPL
jgi:hypothetical protein